MMLLIGFCVSIILIIADQLTKHLALALRGGESVVVIKHLFSLTYVENTGAAWGILKDARWVFLVISGIAMIAIPVIMIIYRKLSPMFTVSLSLILAGAVANMIDRVFLGYVVDFLEFTFIDFPVFNLADTCITVGAVLLGVYIIFFDKYFFKKEEKPAV